MDLLLGVDVGSSAAKVGLFSIEGEALAIATHAYPTSEPKPGYKEQDPTDWWDAVVKGIHEITAGAAADTIRAIGATGHISTFTFVDPEGRPLRPSMGFQDRRAIAELEVLYATFSRSELAQLLGIDLPPAPTWPLPRLLWLLKHEPGTLERARYLLQAKDYINFRLTGSFASDPSSNRGMVNFAEDRPANFVFAKLGIPDLLPPLFAHHEVIGHLIEPGARETGLRPGIPVIAGWNDLNACVLGSGVVAPGQIFNVTGTSEHIGVITTETSGAPELICAPYLPGKRVLYGVTSCGGGSLQWFSRFTAFPIEELLDGKRTASSDLLFLPYLEGERSPIWDPHAAGVLVGLRSIHSRADVARAILEGVAFSLRQNFEIIERRVSSLTNTVVVSGGASKLALWNQIKADLLGTNIVTLRNPHAGILGAAMLAAVAIGLYSDLETAASAMTHLSRQFRPRLNERARSDRLYALYSELYPLLRRTFLKLSAETPTGEQEERSVAEKRAVIFGAGKIARGFIAHLLTLSGYRITFVEKNSALVDTLRALGKYTIHIMGAPEKNITIQDYEVYHSGDWDAVTDAIADVSVVFVSIGGPNLPQIARLLASGFQKRRTSLNIILCENYFQPAQWLRSLISEYLTPEERQRFAREVGIVETIILRSTIEATDEMKAEDPLSLKAQDMFEMPADKEAFIGEIPPIQGLAPKENFRGGLIRKLFTYNCINAVIAYVGNLRGYKLLSEAANDPELVELARSAYQESSGALCQRYGFDPEEQRQFAEDAIAKYQKREIVDPIERNARDPIRKLSPHDRLVGPARLAIEYGIRPLALSRGIAAALRYYHPEDASSVALQQIIRDQGVHQAISEVCGITSPSELTDMIVSSYQDFDSTCGGGRTR